MVPNSTCFPTPIAAANIFHLANETFYFTGSRWMGGAHEHSDWDYIAKDCPQVRTMLKNLGFQPIVDSKKYHKMGCGTTEIQELKSDQGVVQVQLCRDPKAKHEVGVLIREHLFEIHLRLERSLRTDIWNNLYNISWQGERSIQRYIEQVQHNYAWILTPFGQRFMVPV